MVTPGEPLRASDPRRLGDHRLVARLGRGGMGTVFLGEDPTGRRVAIKVINPELAEEEPFRERFRREVTAARRVRAFCTAPVLDAKLTGDPLYVVTEFIDGPTLADAVREGGPLAGSNLDGLAVGIATALAAIHNAGLVHRDLKPSNVLLSSYGPRVIDFGIARALDAAAGTTRTGQLIGTPGYMAPELIRGATVTPAADVFAWGCVLVYAASGRAAFPGLTVQEVLFKVVDAAPCLDGLSGALGELVEDALRKDPEARPAAQELLNRLTGRHDAAEAPPTRNPVEAPPESTRVFPAAPVAAGEGRRPETAPTVVEASGGDDTLTARSPVLRALSRRRNLVAAAVALAGVALVVSFLSSRSQFESSLNVPDKNLRESVVELGHGDSVTDIRTQDAVEPGRREKPDGG